MNHASDSLSLRTTAHLALPVVDRVTSPSPTHKQPSYQVGPTGIEIVDRRQLSHGAIVPNYVVDLYLPIIGYDGLGILTLLYRRANSNDRVMTNLDKFARAGRLGFRRFSKLLDLLEELAIIAVQKPTGAARRLNHHTMITLLDPPTTVPEALTELVLDRTPTPWLVAPPRPERASTPQKAGSSNCHLTVPEMLGDSSADCHLTFPGLSDSSFLGCTLPKDVPIENEPIGIEQGRAGTAAQGCAAALSGSKTDQPLVPSRDQQSAPADTLYSLWQQFAARSREPDIARLKQLSDDFGEEWVAAAITSLGERAPIYKIYAVRVTLDRWRRENSWGSPPSQRIATKRRLSATLGADDPRCSHRVVAHYVETFGCAPTQQQADVMIADVQDDEAWEQTLHDWRLNGHRAQNVAGLLDYYSKRVTRNTAAGRGRAATNQQPKPDRRLESDLLSNPDKHIQELWARVRQAVASQLSVSEFDTWVKPSMLLDVCETCVTIGAGNIFARDHLEAHVRPLLETVFAAETGRQCTVNLVIN